MGYKGFKRKCGYHRGMISAFPVRQAAYVYICFLFKIGMLVRKHIRHKKTVTVIDAVYEETLPVL